MHKSTRPSTKNSTRHRVSSLVGKAPEELAAVVERNLEAIEQYRAEAERARTLQDRIADAITYFTGSMPFVYMHVVFFTVWIVVNTGYSFLPIIDPYPFGMLTTIVSLEAIFLTAFVLVSQNRQALIAERRTELDLHINLLSEYEITRILILSHAVAKRLKINSENLCEELDELEKDVKPEVILKELENRSTNNSNNTASPKNPSADDRSTEMKPD